MAQHAAPPPSDVTPPPPPSGQPDHADDTNAPDAEADAPGEESDDAEEVPQAFGDALQASMLRVLVLLLIGSALALGVLTWATMAQRRDDLMSAEQTVQRSATVSVDFFANRMTSWKQAALTLGRVAITQQDAPEAQNSQLRSILGGLSGDHQITVAWGSAPTIHQLEMTLISDKATSSQATLATPPDWYAQGLKGESWENPFVLSMQGREQLVVAYVTPVSATDGGPVVGVARLVMPVNHLREMLNAKSLGRVGFGMIIAKDGRFIAHPIESFMLHGKRVLEVAQEEGSEVGDALRDAAEAAIAGKSGLLKRPDPLSGQPCWLVYLPIPHTTWIAMYNVYTEEFLPLETVYRRQWINITTCGCLTLLFALLILMKVHRGTNRRLWAGAVAFTVVCALDITLIWSSTLDQSGSKIAHGAIMGYASLHKLKATNDQAAQAAGVPKPYHIPTGIYVQAVNINSGGDATVSGYAWQRFDATVPPDIRRGIIFPDDDKTTTLTEKAAAYVRQDGDRTTVGWSFHIDLRESFVYERYPFDRQDVAIRVWPVDFDKNVVLVPDVDAYQTLNPLTRPGLDPRFSVNGFDPLLACFTLVDDATSTNFGITSYMGQNAFPDLQYNIVLRRQWLGPLLSNLFPLLMVLFTIFVNLMSFTKDDKPWGLYGTIAGLFFTSLLAHLKMRDIFSVHVINYLEYFYGVTYLMIVLVAMNSYLVHARPEHRLLQFRNGMVNRLAFWPIIASLLLLVTYAMFY